MAPREPKEPTRHQLSSQLSYSQNTPSFLLKLQNRIAGVQDDDDEDYEWDGTGRPPIPERPAIPERPDDDPGSADEDAVDEKPQVVVLKQGKHLTEREAENERRKEKGLPPLPEPSESTAKDAKGSSKTESALPKQPKHPDGLSFSSSKSSFSKSKTFGKRKVAGDMSDNGGDETSKKMPKKKAKKAGKTLLSFGDDV